VKTPRLLSSSLAPVIQRYLRLKQTLGYRFGVGHDVLLSLDKFLAEAHCKDLTSESFFGWCQTLTKFTPKVRRSRMSIVRHFCFYRRRTQAQCFVPDPSLFPAAHQPVRPYIFSESEIVRLLKSSSCLRKSSVSPLRPEVFRLAIVLLYTTGLRLGELRRLTIGDYDRHQRTLLVQITKFHKSRLLPLPNDVVREVERYLETRRAGRCAVTPETSLIWNGRDGGRSYTAHGVQSCFRTLFIASGICRPNGQFPRIHDFRHSFAVNALLRWYRSGVDVQTQLPLLAAYMGHASISSTAYYLHFIEPLRSLASTRFAERYGSLITSDGSSKRGAA